MDLFDKCLAFTRVEEVKSFGLYPYYHPITKTEGPVVYMNNKRMIMVGSNNYLGLTHDPRVKQAAIDAIEKYGTGCSGSRLINGSLDIHNKLEEALAQFVGKEAACIFSTGYQTNQGAIVPLIKKGEYIISDDENHASIIQGTLIAKALCGDSILVKFNHNDMVDLENKISALPHDAGKLIVVDGVFSMNGHIAPLPEIVTIARKYNARVMTDDAHALGVIGHGGRGTASYFGLIDETDIIMGTFSKSLASSGGFLASSERVINYIKHNAPAIIFNASMPASNAAAALKALEIIQDEPECIQKLHHNAKRLRNGLEQLGFNVIKGETPIIPVIIGDDVMTFSLWKKLFDFGVYTNPIIFPATPQGQQLIRCSVMATHTDEHIDYVIGIFEKAGAELKLLHAKV
ncbi:MAG: aminotransferase class I/II-fold pyridoxal phosphate-dependent enzyme [Spirochaetes bacterium]|nr:aminotransferase class I/II-fold pyridoxal phosphate-dependent enzyme [Spirochaetota bacterium]